MKLSRRTFLKFLAAGAGAAAALLLSPLPWRGAGRLARYSQLGPEALPCGKEEKRNGLISAAQNLIPVEVRLVDGLPCQTRPMQGHVLGGRGLPCLAAAEIQNLSRPSRLTRPLLKENGKFKPISWEQALAVLWAEFSAAGSSVACISGTAESVGAALLRDLLVSAGSRGFIRAPDQRSAMRGAFKSLGIEAEPAFSIAESDCTLSIGADWLESWGASYYLRNRLHEDYGGLDFSFHMDDMKPKSRHIYCGPYQNATARYAGRWLQVKPGHEELMLLAIGGRLLSTGGNILKMRSAALGEEYFEIFDEVFSASTPESIAAKTGLSANDLSLCADELLHASKPLVIVGSALGFDQNPRLHILGFCLNLMLGNIGAEGGFYFLPPLGELSDFDFYDWLGAVAANKQSPAGSLPKLLIVHECNPAYALPASFSERRQDLYGILRSIPFKAALSVYANETTALCDLVLPVSASLERREQMYLPVGPHNSGYFSITEPAFSPPKGVFSVAEILGALSGKAAPGAAPHSLEREALMKACRKLSISQAEASMSNSFLVRQQANISGLLPSAHLLKEKLCDKKNLLTGVSYPENHELRLFPLAYQEHLNFSMGLSAFRASPLFDKAVSHEKGLAVVWMHPDEANLRGLTSGSRLVLKTPLRQTLAVLAASSAVAPGCVGMFAGFGHWEGDLFSKGYGANLFDFYELAFEQNSGAAYLEQLALQISV